jgi:predicted small metal-binding protein
MAVAFVIKCQVCGLAVQGDTETEVVRKAADHVDERHADMAADLTLDVLRARVEEV